MFAENFYQRQIQIREIFPFVIENWRQIAPDSGVTGCFSVNLIESRPEFIPPARRHRGRYLVVFRDFRAVVLDRQCNEAHLLCLREHAIPVAPRLPLELKII